MELWQSGCLQEGYACRRVRRGWSPQDRAAVLLVLGLALAAGRKCDVG